MAQLSMVFNADQGAYFLNCELLKHNVAPKDQEKYKICSVKSVKDGQRSFLRSLDTKGAIFITEDENDSVEFLVECTRSFYVEKLLGNRDIYVSIVGYENNPEVVRNRSQRIANPVPSPISRSRNPWKKEEAIITWKDYYDYETIYKWMHEIERIYPATCSISIIGNSVEGRPIKLLKISNSDATNSGVWLDGCTHSREWITVSVVTYIADCVARNFHKLPTFMTNKDWYFVPVLNPDGYHHTHTVDRMWRKNRARFGKTIVGVDLNRNFGMNWGYSTADSAPMGDPSHLNYRGTNAFSEPETAAVKDSILYSGIPFKIFLSYHAFSEAIAFPWCFQPVPCPDYVSLLEGATSMARAIFDTTGRMYKVGNFKDIMYFASGTSIDWSYGIAKIPFSYLVELRSKEFRFTLPKDQILDCCKESFAAVKALAEFVDTKKCLNCNVYEDKRKLM